MEKEKIPFNYFYQMFIKEYNKIFEQKEKNKIGDIVDIAEWLDEFFTWDQDRNEKISICQQALYRICEAYVTLADADIKVYPKDHLEFVNQILETIHENSYRESFLMSLQCIYTDYLYNLGKGNASLESSRDEEIPPTLEITLNKYNKIITFEGINMSPLEEDKLLTKFIAMEEKNLQGPLQKVHYKKVNF